MLKCSCVFFVACCLLINLNAQAQAPAPPADLPDNAVNDPAAEIAQPMVPEVPKPEARAPVFKPANANANPNVVLRNANQMALRNANQMVVRNGMLVNADMERSILESMSSSRLSFIEVPPEVLKLLPLLDDSSFQVREEASQKLLDPSWPDNSIWAVLDRLHMSEEAHQRLLNVAYRRVMERARGALGIRMGQAPLERPGVVIQATLPGLPAEKFLKPGDVIEEIDGQKVQNTVDLVRCIQKYSPGQEVKLKLRRPERDAQGRPVIGPDGKMIERPFDLAMPLGNADDLDKADPGDQRQSQNMQLQQRTSEAQTILTRFASSPRPTNSK